MVMPTEQMVRDAAEDVAHEIFLFWAACAHTNNRFAYQSWYVLARNLMDFFDTLPDDRDRDAILAGDFFDLPGTWHGKRQTISCPSDYAEYRIAAHKRAAHLTYGRADSGAREPIESRTAYCTPIQHPRRPEEAEERGRVAASQPAQ